jgi:palmitoyltransferase ZDHHC9/14/18
VNIHCSPLFRDDIFDKMRPDAFASEASLSVPSSTPAEMMHITPRHKDNDRLLDLQNIPEGANEDDNAEDNTDTADGRVHSDLAAAAAAARMVNSGSGSVDSTGGGDGTARAGTGDFGTPSVFSEHEGADPAAEELYEEPLDGYSTDDADRHAPGHAPGHAPEDEEAASVRHAFPHSHSAESMADSVAASDLDLALDVPVEKPDAAPEEEEEPQPQQHWLQVRRPALYLSWPGRSIFACGGRCVWGPQWANVVYSALLILVPVALYQAFPARCLAEAHGGSGASAEWAAIVAAVLTAASLLTLGLAAGSNPGLIPRRVEGPQSWQRRQPVMASGRTHTVKYCSTCNIFRPPRAFHCNICDACVSRFDHHCPWLGTCVGRGNYHYFLWFLAAVMSLCFFILGTSIAAPIMHSRSIQDLRPGLGFWDAFDAHRTHHVISWVLSLYGLLVAVFISWLTGFHVMLIWNGVTTVEHLKRVYDGEKHPESRGCIHNLGGLCFSNDRDRAIHESETVRYLVEMTGNPDEVVPEIEKHLRSRKGIDDMDIEMAVTDLTKGVLVGRERGDRELANRGVEFISEW